MKRPNLREQLAPYIRRYDWPVDILVETISVCNLKCIMCPQPKLTRPSGTMSMSLWNKIIDELAEKSPSTRVWPALMGESLLDKHIFPRIRYAKDQGIQTVTMNTNLLPFSDDMVEVLFDCGLDGMTVGIDGFQPETYAAIRVQGKLEKVLGKLHLILNERDRRGLTKPEVTVQFIVMEENESEEQAFIDYWKNSGLNIKIKIRPRLDWAYGVDSWSALSSADDDERVACTWLLRQMVVYWNGQVPQCDADWDGKTDYGNVNNQSIEAIWNGRIRKLQENHLSQRFDGSALCPGCQEWKAGLSEYVQVNTPEDRLPINSGC